MANETLEERNLKLLEAYIEYERTRDSSRYVDDEKAMSAARLLGELKCKTAVPLLVKCILVTKSYDAGVSFRKALEAIGRPALVVIEITLEKSRFDGLLIYPGGPQRTHLAAARDNILYALRPKE